MTRPLFVTGFSNWPYYLGGFALPATPYFLMSLLRGNKFSDIRVGLEISFLVLPLLIGFIIGWASGNKLGAFNWGIFFGVVCFLRSIGTGYLTPVNQIMSGIIYGGISVVAISLSALLGMFFKYVFEEGK